MNEIDRPNDEIEGLLKQAHPAEPSDELKERVLHATREAWTTQSHPALWRIALRRVVISAAAAVFIVVLTNAWSDSTVARVHSSGPRPAALESPDLIDAEIPYRALIGHMATIRKPATVTAGALLDYVQRLHDVLSQTEQNGASTSDSPIEGRSRLPDLPDRHCS
jgi:hypothetical protein